MMRGIVVAITAVLARVFLKEPKYAHHIFSLSLIVAGVALVGVCRILWAPKTDGESGTSVFGVVMLLLAQFFAAS